MRHPENRSPPENMGNIQTERGDCNQHGGGLRVSLRPPQVSRDSSEGNPYKQMKYGGSFVPTNIRG
jgi:hypothetical protein